MCRERLLKGLRVATVFAAATICVGPPVLAQGRCINAHGTAACNTAAQSAARPGSCAASSPTHTSNRSPRMKTASVEVLRM